MIKYELKDEYIELCKLLKIVGLLDSGGIAKLVIADGQVLVNGEVDTRKRYKVRAGDVIEYDGEKIIVDSLEK